MCESKVAGRQKRTTSMSATAKLQMKKLVTLKQQQKKKKKKKKNQ